MRIREAKASDAKAVFALLDQLCNWDKCGRYPPKAFAAMLKPPLKIFIAEEGGKLVGMATLVAYLVPRYNQPCVIVDELVVEEASRRKGVGAALMAKAESYASKIGAHSVQLASSRERKAAHRFYRALGYDAYAYMFRKRL